MAEPITLTMLGEPVAFARPRPRFNGPQYITPTKQRYAALNLRLIAQQQMRGRAPLDGPVRVDFLAEMTIAKSWPASKRAAAFVGEIAPTKKPDLSNQLKLVEDALNGIVFRDDCQIVEFHACKRYSTQPKIVVTVSPIITEAK